MEDSHTLEVKSTLEAMGFPQDVINKAYEKAPVKTIEGVINFIEANPQLSNQGETKMDIENPNTGNNDIDANPSLEPMGEPITPHINTTYRDQLISFGYKRDPAEKALFMTQNKSVEAALEWLNANKDAPDFNEALFIVRQPDEHGNVRAPSSNMSKEEIKEAARQLQEKARIRRAQKDKELAEQKELDRVRTGKDMTEAKRKMEELAVEIRVNEIRREKEEKAKAMAHIMAEIEKDRYDKTGVKKKVLKPADEVFSDIFKKMTKVYPIGSMSAPVLQKCLQTVVIYSSKLKSQLIPLGNILKEPTNQKFLEINLENKAFMNRVGGVIGGKTLLLEIGFEEEQGILKMKEFNQNRIISFVNLIQKSLERFPN